MSLDKDKQNVNVQGVRSGAPHKFTPGPWEWLGDGLYAPNLETVIAVEDSGKGWDMHSPDLVMPNPADRPLLASAPDLYEALTVARHIMSGLAAGKVSREVWESFYEPFKQMDEALAKARGQSFGTGSGNVAEGPDSTAGEPFVSTEVNP